MKIDAPDDAEKPIHDVVRDLSSEAAREGLDANATRFRSVVERLGKQLEGDLTVIRALARRERSSAEVFPVF
jgi:hypothetical protein